MGSTYDFTLSWLTNDYDGSVDHVEYTVDPPNGTRALAGAETTRVRTTDTSVLLHFPGTPPGPNSLPHVFAIRAIDDRGRSSDLVTRAFLGADVAPDVVIYRPERFEIGTDTRGITAIAPPMFRFAWASHDPDRNVVSYRWRMLSGNDPIWTLDPDSLGREGAATDWANWNSAPATSGSVVIEAPVSPTPILLAVIGVDDAGAWSPVSIQNLARVQIVPRDSLGPLLYLAGSDFSSRPVAQDWDPGPDRAVRVHVSAGATPSILWEAFPRGGEYVTGFRWVLDPTSLTDETPRSDEATDVHHWSALASTPSVTLSPLSSGEHWLYVEAHEEWDRSIGAVNFRVGGTAMATASEAHTVREAPSIVPQRLASSSMVRRSP